MSEPTYPVPTAEDLRVMALTIYGEARGEDVVGRQAVAWVIKNRTRLYIRRMHEVRHAPDINAYASICLARNQFSCWNANDPNAEKLHSAFPLHEQSFVACLHNAIEVLGGYVDDPTDGATHYLNVPVVLKQAGKLPSWAADPRDNQKVNEQLVVARIQRHTFLRTA